VDDRDAAVAHDQAAGRLDLVGLHSAGRYPVRRPYREEGGPATGVRADRDGTTADGSRPATPQSPAGTPSTPPEWFATDPAESAAELST
jgi:hypothetical protein